MTPVDIWAAVAASAAGATISVRAFMLRPHQSMWSHAPAPVWVMLTALGIVLGMSAASLWFGAHASAREAMAYTLLAGTGGVMLWNLHRHGREEEVRRQRVEAEVRHVMELSGPPAAYRMERRS